MNGRPERAQPNVRFLRCAQPRSTRSHALPLTVTIVVVTIFVAALFTRAAGSGAAPIGPPPVVSTPNRSAGGGGSADPSANATSLVPGGRSVPVL